jgi:uncharacterized membrane protein
MSIEAQIQAIEAQIKTLSQQMLGFSNQLYDLQQQLQQLKARLQSQPQPQSQPQSQPQPQPQPQSQPQPQPSVIIPKVITPQPQSQPQPQSHPQPSFNFENFVGLRLLHFIGIIVLVIGLAIGVKYAIDRNLIGPAARIILAYIAAGGLLFTGFRLEKKYKGFSAVLLSGAMASFYFTTYAAFEYYHLMPRALAFILMLLFTGFTVWQSLRYNRQEIAILALVGAYGVPFLVGQDTGHAGRLFGYIAIINAGILFLSFKKDWRLLNYLAQSITWLIFIAWFISSDHSNNRFAVGVGFATAFYLIFYLASLAYKVLRYEKFGAGDVLRILLNTVVYYAVAHVFFTDNYEKYTGLFTLAFALFHIGIAWWLRRNPKVDTGIHYLLMAIGIAFVTIAVPIELKVRYTIMVWTAMAVTLFYFGRYRRIFFYEILAWPLCALALINLLGLWNHAYGYGRYDFEAANWQPLANTYLLTSIVYIGALALIQWLHLRRPHDEAMMVKYKPLQWLRYLLPGLCMLLLYFAFNNEIRNYFHMRFQLSGVELQSDFGDVNKQYDTDWTLFQYVWQIYYFLFFCAVLYLPLLTRWRTPAYKMIVFGLTGLALLVFVLTGVDDLNIIRNKFFEPHPAYVHVSHWYLHLRYIGYALVLLLVMAYYRFRQREPRVWQQAHPVLWQIVLPLVVLLLLSTEMMHWVRIITYQNKGDMFAAARAANRVGITVLWGVFSFAIMSYGVWKKLRPLRILAIILLGITILKLTLWDTMRLSQGYKIIAYISLGIILLVVSFLYQKFKGVLFGEEERKAED